MADDDGYQAGHAYVQVLPDFRGWHKSIQKSLQDEQPTFEEWGDKWGKAAVAGFTERLKVGFEHLPEAKIKASVDTAKVDEKLDKAARDRKSTILVDVKKVGANAGGLLGPLATSPVGLGALGALALGPQAIGLGAVGAGLGLSAGASAAGLAAFGTLAKSEITKVEAANKALSAAEAAFGKATTSKQRTAALQAEAKAVKGLSPAEVQLGKDITGLTSAWSALGKAESPVVASAVAPWAAAATSGMRLLKPLVNDTGSALGYLGKEADTAVKSPFWDKFSNVLGKTAEGGVKGFGDALGHVADGLGHLFVDFAPDIQKLPGLIDKWSASFDRWARSYNKSGFEHFISGALSPGNVAALKSDLGAVVKILENVSKATVSFSPAAFTGLSNVLSILAKLSPGQIEAIAAIYAYSKLTAGTSLSAGSVLGSLSGLGGKRAPAKEGETPSTSTGGKIGNIAATATVALPIAAAVEQAVPRGPGGEWVNSWAPYEKIFTNDLPKAWSISYEAFQVEFAGKITSWFTQSFPHAFDVTRHALAVAGHNMGHWLGEGWDDTGGWLVSRFAQGGSWAVHALASSGRWLVGTGESAARGLASGWDRGRGYVTGALGAAYSWVTGPLRGAGSWLVGAGEAVLGGFLRGLEAGWKPVTSFVGGIAGWVSAHKGPIEADRQLLIPHGIATMAGYHEGLTRGWQPGMKFIQSIAPKIASKAATTPNGLGYSAAQWGQLQALEAAAKAGKHLDAHQLHELHAAHEKHLAAMGGIVRAASTRKQQTAPWGFDAGTPFGRVAAARDFAAASAKLPGVGRPVQPGTLRLQVSYGSSGNALTDAIVRALRYDIGAKAGGDAQAHLGSGKART